MEAIQTRYAGCHFRSRLEARWAVLFDALGVGWEYEPQGFMTPAGPYLPDFHLPCYLPGHHSLWVEIKGGAPLSDTEWQKIRGFQAGLGWWENRTPGDPAYVVFKGDIPRIPSVHWEGKPCRPHIPCWGVWEESHTSLQPAWWVPCPPHNEADLTHALELARSARFDGK